MKLRKLPVIVFAFAALSGHALADTITYSDSFVGATDATLAVSQFNPGLGTLQSATFALSAGMTSSAYASNDGDFFVGWDKLLFSMNLQGDAPYSNLFINAGNPAQRLVGSGTADGDFTSSELLRITTGVNPSYWTYTAPTLSAAQTFAQGALSGFIGSGDLSFFLTTVNEDAFSVARAQTAGTPVLTMGLQTQVFSDVTVTYVYAPIPEPETYALMTTGLALMAFAVRRRNQRHAG